MPWELEPSLPRALCVFAVDSVDRGTAMATTAVSFRRFWRLSAWCARLLASLSAV